MAHIVMAYLVMVDRSGAAKPLSWAAEPESVRHAHAHQSPRRAVDSESRSAIKVIKAIKAIKAMEVAEAGRRLREQVGY